MKSYRKSTHITGRQRKSQKSEVPTTWPTAEFHSRPVCPEARSRARVALRHAPWCCASRQGLLGLVFLSSEHFLCTSPKNQSGSRRNSSRRAWVAHGIGAKNCLLETNCVLKCSTHVCPSVVCLSAGGYMWMAGRMEQGEGVGKGLF